MSKKDSESKLAASLSVHPEYKHVLDCTFAAAIKLEAAGSMHPNTAGVWHILTSPTYMNETSKQEGEATKKGKGT